ncbi:MAG: GNAT family N-acetyltransferase [Chloroflexi bacterium]|nr:GNAT family N-acetyltransferase [Chloroflexota bacterium]
MNTNGKMRAFDIQNDIDGMVDLVEIAFAGDLARWGSNFREQMQMAQKMVPLLKFLSRMSSVFRHTFDGFVWENGHQMASFVMVQKVGLSKFHWQIGNVATHPDYRRQGLAHKLVTRAMDHAKSHGATMCSLEVRSVAEPAYNLYRSLGFVHYDSNTVLKLDTLPTAKEKPIHGYSLRPMKFGEWRQRYELALQETPQDVQDFVPVSKTEFRISPIERITTPLVLRFQRLDVLRWAVEKNGELVGTMLLAANRKPNLPHELEINILSAHREALAEPLLTLALETLQSYPRAAMRISVRSSYAQFISLFKEYGFAEIDVNHKLGTKL